jgi:hypothetical protein
MISMRTIMPAAQQRGGAFCAAMVSPKLRLYLSEARDKGEPGAGGPGSSKSEKSA